MGGQKDGRAERWEGRKMGGQKDGRVEGGGGGRWGVGFCFLKRLEPWNPTWESLRGDFFLHTK